LTGRDWSFGVEKMRIFVSHQKKDEVEAARVASTLRTNGHEVYLDIIDTNLGKNGDDLGDYIRAQMSKCDSLIAVISISTKESSWVPWEIGVATEKNFPLSTYLTDNSTPPEFLKKWPVLKSIANLNEFAKWIQEFQTNRRRLERTRIALSDSAKFAAEKSDVAEFHKNLKRAIYQS